MSNLNPIITEDGTLIFSDDLSVVVDSSGTLFINGVDIPIVNSVGVLQFATEDGKIKIPDFVLCKASKNKIGTLRCVDKKMSIKFNDIGSVSFKIYRYIDNEPNPYYDLVKGSKYIYVPDINYYRITSCNLQSEDTENEYKECTAEETQCNLLNRKLDTFIINMGTVESVEYDEDPNKVVRVKFYNEFNQDRSLLHLILREKAPEWTIGHVDTELCDLERSFEVSIQDVYSFLTQDVATAFDCIFFFDTINNLINVYKTDNTGESTNIHISHKNLASSFSINTSDDDIKTCLTLTGEDELTIREVNMGFDKIYNLDYYHDPEFMTQGLYDAFAAWKEKRNNYVNIYTVLLREYQRQIEELNKLKYYGESDGEITKLDEILAVPEDKTEEVFGKYSKNGLQDLIDILEDHRSMYSGLGYGNETNKYYESKYVPVERRENLLKDILSNVIEKKIADLESEMYEESYSPDDALILDVGILDENVLSGGSYYNRMLKIQDEISMPNNFTPEQLTELSTFIKEDELDDSNYVVTEDMTDEDRFEMLRSFLDFGQKELDKISQPTYSFSATLANLFVIPEFKEHAEDFKCGNYISVSINDNYRLDKVKILGFDIDYENPENFTVSFGNVRQGKEKNIFTDVTNALNIANKTATTVSFNSSNWKNAAQESSEIYQHLSDGLLGAGYALTNGVNSDFIIDNRGLFVKASAYLDDGTTENPYSGDQVGILGGRILFTDDNWTTVSEAIGRITINGEDTFGVIAKAIIAGYIEGSEIIGGSITGTTISNGDGTFVADENGKVTCSDIDITGGTINIGDNLIVGEDGITTLTGANVTGDITATNLTLTGTANIGGFKVNGTSMYTDDKSSISSGKGILLSSTNGIGIGDNKFYVDKNGYLTCANAVINNGAFSVDKNGNVVCKSIKITGDTTSKNTTIGGSYVDSTGNIVCTSSGNIVLDNTDPASFGAIMIEYPGNEKFSLIRPYMSGNNPNIAYNAAGGTMYLGAFETSEVHIGNASNASIPFTFWYAEGESLVCTDSVTAPNIGGNSSEKIKDNIVKYDNSALNVIKSAVVYEYDLKENLKKNIYNKNYGFVIERETPDEIISYDRESINLYSAIALNWKGTQELYSLYKAQQSEIESLKLEVNELKKLIVS